MFKIGYDNKNVIFTILKKHCFSSSFMPINMLFSIQSKFRQNTGVYLISTSRKNGSVSFPQSNVSGQIMGCQSLIWIWIRSDLDSFESMDPDPGYKIKAKAFAIAIFMDLVVICVKI